MGWWFFTRSAVEALTRPHADVERSDRAVVDLARDSVIGRMLHHVSSGVRDAWATARARTAAAALMHEITPASGSSAWRVRGWIAVVAGVSVLGLDALKPTPIGPLSWLAPSIVVAAGVLTMMAAAPLARAAAARRTERSGAEANS